jgi:hypothetical protein
MMEELRLWWNAKIWLKLSILLPLILLQKNRPFISKLKVLLDVIKGVNLINYADLLEKGKNNKIDYKLE